MQNKKIDMEHSHDRAALKNITKAFVVGVILNSGFIIIEAIAGLYSHSLSLLADAGHNLSDVASLVLVLFANRLAKKQANDKYSFGYRQSTVLVALLNGGILLFALGAVAYEAIIRITHPHPIEGGMIAMISGVGIVINSVSALMFLKDKDLNVKGAYLHMASDAGISLGVVIAGIVIVYTRWYWLDSVVSLLLVIVVVIGTWGLLKESLRLTLNGVPKDIDMNEVKNYFLSFQGVTEIHDLHIWAISTTETALTIHLVIPNDIENDVIYEDIKEALHHKFNITHSTIQIEKNKGQFHCEQKC